jgi:hypothetical protein
LIRASHSASLPEPATIWQPAESCEADSVEQQVERPLHPLPVPPPPLLLPLPLLLLEHAADTRPAIPGPRPTTRMLASCRKTRTTGIVSSARILAGHLTFLLRISLAIARTVLGEPRVDRSGERDGQGVRLSAASTPGSW